MSEIVDTYKTIERRSEGIYKDKGSKFISFAIPIVSVDEVKGLVQEFRKQYYDARHVCYAYRLGYMGEAFRANDDGEPSGTAGKPILGQLLSHEITNVLIVVVRYFGGVKLGVSGLINAYKLAALDCVEANTIMQKIVFRSLILKFAYPQMNHVMRLVKSFELKVAHQKFEMDCELELAVRLKDFAMVRSHYEKMQGVEIMDQD